MGKPQTARKSTILNDPFASVIPMHGAEDSEADRDEEVMEDTPAPAQRVKVPDVAPKPFKRQKLTVHLRPDLVERVKNAAYWNPRLTIASIAELGIYEAIERIEKQNGGPYPRREEELRGGRPMK